MVDRLNENVVGLRNKLFFKKVIFMVLLFLLLVICNVLLFSITPTPTPISTAIPTLKVIPFRTEQFRPATGPNGYQKLDIGTNKERTEGLCQIGIDGMPILEIKSFTSYFEAYDIYIYPNYLTILWKQDNYNDIIHIAAVTVGPDSIFCMKTDLNPILFNWPINIPGSTISKNNSKVYLEWPPNKLFDNSILTSNSGIFFFEWPMDKLRDQSILKENLGVCGSKIVKFSNQIINVYYPLIIYQNKNIKIDKINFNNYNLKIKITGYSIEKIEYSIDLHDINSFEFIKNIIYLREERDCYSPSNHLIDINIKNFKYKGLFKITIYIYCKFGNNEDLFKSSLEPIYFYIG